MATLVPRGKLDADAANGPEGVGDDWDQVDWGQVEDDVRRLRQRIFVASRAGDLNKVRNLQKLMLRCRANALLSVRRVTEVNTGRNTAGVDGRVIRSARVKLALAAWLQRPSTGWQARPVRRVYIPKSNGKQRPLGIPVIVDRALQARALSALEPEWEARFEARSYGFRPGRSCQDAIAAIYWTVCGRQSRRRWVLDADLTAAFDRIDHQFLLDAIGLFPGREMIAGWLRAGVIEAGTFAATAEGTPQGGVISPLLLNIALHGMEAAAGVQYQTSGREAGGAAPGTPVLVRYADDLVALCHSKDEASHVKAQLVQWLTPRGLTFNEDKTRVVALDAGFDFLGFTIRRYPNNKLIITPSKDSMSRMRRRLSDEMKALRGANAVAVLNKVTPIIRGWSAYYRSVVSSRAFHHLDDHMWKLTYKWAKFQHPQKSKSWIIHRYFGQFHQSRKDRWIFGDRDSGRFLIRFSWTKIVRHSLVKTTASPDDPDLKDYWLQRRRREPAPPVNSLILRLLQQQDGRCTQCRRFLIDATHGPQSPHEWQTWWKATRKAMATSHIAAQQSGTPPTDGTELHLIHSTCKNRQPPSPTPTGLPEPGAA